jgi:hypothetical protein
MSITPTNGPRYIGNTHSGAKPDARLLQLTLWLVLIAKVASSLYASLDARGLYADGASYLVGRFLGSNRMLAGTEVVKCPCEMRAWSLSTKVLL